MRNRIVSLVLALLIALSSMFMAAGAEVTLEETKANVELADTGSNIYGLADDVQDGQILQCWCWSFENIKEMLPKIAAQGFTAIQTSPIQPIKESTRESWSTFMGQCWVVYQPVAFNIEDNYRNAFGTKKEFKAMCAEAEKYGIKVIVDTIFNHTANDMSENTVHPWVPSEIKNDSNCWHDISKNIYNFDNRYDTTHYCLTGLPDLNTSNSTVQKHCINFLKECIDAGADGFRFDAAKHIETPSDASGTKSDFWPNVLNAATEYAQETKGFTPYYYGEILGSPGGGLGIDAYTKYMSVTDTGANDIRQAVCDGNASRAAQSGISCGAAPSKTVQWTESHDNFKDDGTRFISDHNINKTWAIVGARNEVCGLYLARPENMDTTMIGDADVTSWASTAVRSVNKFKNYFRGQSEYMSSSGSVAYIERGTSGVILVNTGGTYYNNVSVPAHKIASGTYTDVITGNTFTVSNGYISGDIGDSGIAVVYDVDSAGTLTKGSVTDLSLAGTFNDWDTSANVMVASSSNTATTSVILDAGTYTFKVKGGGLWFSNKSTIEDETGSSGWTFKPDVDENCTLIASKAGKYTFSFNTNTQKVVVKYSEDTSSGVYVKGTFNDWDSSAQMSYAEGSNTVSASIYIPAGSYSFKIHNRAIGLWYSNSGKITDTTGSSGWTMKTSVDDNCSFTATGGTYTFSYNLSTNKLVVTLDSADAPQTTTAAETTTSPVTTTPKEENSPYYLKGTFNNWGADIPFLFTDNDDILTATTELEAGTYQFKLHKTDTNIWFGNSGTINDKTGTEGWTFISDVTDKCTLVATGGTYTFTLARSTKKLVVEFTPSEEDATETTAPTATTPSVEASPYYLKGTFNEWKTNIPFMFTDDADILVATTELEAGTYQFKLHKTDTDLWYGLAGEINDSTGSDEFIFAKGGDKCTLNATGGTYTFTLARSTKKLVVEFTPFEEETTAPETTATETTVQETTVPETTSVPTGSQIFLRGDFNDWESTEEMISEENSSLVTSILELEEGTYSFKIQDKSKSRWYGNDGVIKDSTGSGGWSMHQSAGDATLKATGGTYIFTFDTAEKRLIVTHYPTGVDPNTPVNPTLEEYTVTFVDFDGTVIDTQFILEGGTAVAPQDPVREGNEQFYYVFTGWDTPFITVTEDLTVTALYEEKVKEYKVTFLNYDNKVLDVQNVTYGASATAPTDPVREGNAQYSYTFKGWDTDFTSVTKDITVTALYHETVNDFKVTFVDYDGRVIGIQGVTYGSSAIAPNDPVREGDAQYTYTFKGWDTDFTSVTEDLTVTALYSQKVNEYSITCNEGNFNFVGADTAKYGDTYSFEIVADKGYEVVNVTSGTTVLTPDKNGIYTINKVIGDVNINVYAVKVNSISGVTVTLDSKIGLNYYIKLSDDVVNDAKARVIFTLPDGGKKYVYVKNVTFTEDGFYMFTCELAAKEMASNVKAQLVTSTFKSEVFEYSVKEYAEYILSSNEAQYENAKPLVKAMLNYGANAQTYFNYNLGTLANESLTDAEKALADIDLAEYRYKLEGKEEGVSYYGSKLSLESETAIKHYFYFEDKENIPKITVNEEEVVAKKKGAYYEVKISDILAQNLDEKVVVNVGNLSLDYNALSYAELAINGSDVNLKNVMKALCIYNAEADKYIK